LDDPQNNVQKIIQINLLSFFNQDLTANKAITGLCDEVTGDECWFYHRNIGLMTTVSRKVRKKNSLEPEY
jgi:hypothetical protein